MTIKLDAHQQTRMRLSSSPIPCVNKKTFKIVVLGEKHSGKTGRWILSRFVSTQQRLFCVKVQKGQFPFAADAMLSRLVQCLYCSINFERNNGWEWQFLLVQKNLLVKKFVSLQLKVLKVISPENRQKEGQGAGSGGNWNSFIDMTSLQK